MDFDNIYIDGDTGYLVLTCGYCRKWIKHVDAGDTLADLVGATDRHEKECREV